MGTQVEIVGQLRSIIIALNKIVSLIEEDHIAPPTRGVKRLPSLPSQTSSMNYSVAQAALHLGVSERMVWKLVHDRKIAHARLGRRVLIPGSAIDDYIQKNIVPVFDAKDFVRDMFTERPRKRRRGTEI